jgi:hypothetical protein
VPVEIGNRELAFGVMGIHSGRCRISFHWGSRGGYMGCPSLGVAQPDPSNRIDYDVLRKLSSSDKLAIHINPLLRTFHPLEKNSTHVSLAM